MSWNGRVPKTYHPLRSERTLIGRDENNDVVLVSQDASRFHTSIVREAGRYRILNHGVTGTYANGELVPPEGRVLHDEDDVRCADVEFTFHVDPLPGSTKPTAKVVVPPHLRPPEPEPRDDGEFDFMLGSTPVMRAMFQLVRAWGPSPNTVVVTGPTGSGKELVARALHLCSDRAHRRMVPFNVGALSDEIAMSELFGHKRGAFTGATADRIGLFEEADGSTIFIDEIGDASPRVQVALLRVLQEGEILRVGESRPRPVNARVLVATHRNLEAEVASGRFREDLFYRLCGCILVVPPLSARTEDIPRLAVAFLQKHAPGKTATSETLAMLQEHAWPGNVRELHGAIASAAARAGAVLQPAHFQHLTWAERVRAFFDPEYLMQLLRTMGERQLAVFLLITRHRLRLLLASFGLKSTPEGRASGRKGR